MNEKYWDVLNALYTQVLKAKDCSKGVAALRERFEKNKARLIPLFDDDGRIIMQAERKINKELVQGILREGSTIASGLAKSTKYIGVIKDGGYYVNSYLYDIANQFTATDFCNNSLEKKVANPAVPGKNLPAKTKLTKYFKADIVDVAKDAQKWSRYGKFHDYGYENRELVAQFVIDLYSQLISSVKMADNETVYDYLVLSINPVDLSLASGHNIPWGSCHTIFNDWGSSAGWPTYAPASIIDPVTAIAFTFRNSTPIQKTNIMWEKRLWRCNVFFSQNDKSCTIGNQYPGFSTVNTKQLTELLGDVLRRLHNRDENYRFAIAYQGEAGELSKNAHYEKASVPTVKGVSWLHCDYPKAAVRLESSKYDSDMQMGDTDINCVVCGKVRTARNDGAYSRLHCGCM